MATLQKSKLKNKLNKTAVLNCKKCTKRIHDSAVRYLNSFYHVACFKCSQCGTSLQQKNVFFDEANRSLFCEPCYLNTLDICAACNDPILAESIALSDEVRFHRNCFRCDKCQCLLNEYFFEWDNKRYCSKDYIVECAPLCGKCKKPIYPEADSQTIIHICYQGENYHPGCFVCDKCERTLDSSPAELEASECSIGATNRKRKAPGDDEPITANISDDQCKYNKIFYPVGGQKLCRDCALQCAEVEKSS